MSEFIFDHCDCHWIVYLNFPPKSLNFPRRKCILNTGAHAAVCLHDFFVLFIMDHKKFNIFLWDVKNKTALNGH